MSADLILSNGRFATLNPSSPTFLTRADEVIE
jgi:hypothetical protein